MAQPGQHADSAAGPAHRGASANPAIAIPAQTLLRKITLRPLPTDHPYFTGSNPYLDLNNPQRSYYDQYNQQPAGPSNTDAPLSTLVYGPWDVDNDGDGVPDSIWVDLGLPVQQSPDGRRYKPLFAILCLDMDGKLNLNAHSNWRHTPSTTGAPSRFAKVTAPFARNDPTSTSASYYLKVGSGYGPAEISLHPVIEPAVDNVSGNLLVPTTELAKLLGGNTSVVPAIEGRDGEIGIAPGLQAVNSNPGPGITEIDDPIGWMRELDYPQIKSLGNVFPQLEHLYLPTTTSFGVAPGFFSPDPSVFNGAGIWIFRSGFGTPNDLDGDGMLALDLRGQPMYIDFPGLVNDNYAGGSGWGERNDTIDDAYELDLSYNAANDGYSGIRPGLFTNYSSNFLANAGDTSNIVSVDAPFSAAELERILRWHDGDVPSLPDRLIRLAPLAFTSQNPLLASNSISNRYPNMPELAQMPNVLTTHSFDVPMPSMIFTAPEQANMLVNSRSTTTNTMWPMVNSHITQLAAARIRYEASNPAAPVDLAISQLLRRN